MVTTSFIGSQRLPTGSGGVILRSRTVVQPRYRVNTCYVARYLNGSVTIGYYSILVRPDRIHRIHSDKHTRQDKQERQDRQERQERQERRERQGRQKGDGREG